VTEQAQGAIAIIPARMGSTRFPGKVLADKTGHPLIWHVHEAARRARRVSRVVIATDDRRVYETVEAFGGRAVMTGEHENGTSRLSEAARVLGLGAGEIVVNVQGDEPELDPEVIDDAVEALVATGAEVATVASPFGAGEDPADPNIVKAVVGCTGLALYFSRLPIPLDRDGAGARGEGVARPLKHIGLYAYRVGFLHAYSGLPATPLERTERLEQLRVLEHGHRIAVAIRECHHHGIDTPGQYEAFLGRWRSGAGERTGS
jgi:3-deoxy-manno-octulosonate cytidylyltransferase (CMP-KDO synthetase)